MAQGSAVERNQLQTQLEGGAAQLSVELGPEQVEKLLDFLGLLKKWNRSYNLTAVDNPPDMVERHLLDSLALVPHISGTSLLDIGTGAGLPGIPLAIALPHLRVVMLDSAGKKVRFINHVIRELGLGSATTEHTRIESYLPDICPDTITARAVAALPKMIGWCDRLMGPETRLLAMKGRYPEQELLALPAGFMVDKVIAMAIPGGSADRHLAVVKRAAQKDT
jgi:16S rRNA (guanine527-N7)-methyltransferase